MRNMKLINDFKMEKVAKKVLEVMAEKQMTLAEAEVFPEYLERTIKKNSELNEKAKRFTVNENLFYSSNKSQNS
jgi:histone H3/H4|nr:MAG TPA: hypothetical protein [Caudoviricetes sp.]